MKLGVNVDHIATLREARKTRYPDPVHAAILAEKAGADQITIHLREDRRHIQERDVVLMNDILQTRLNLEMAMSNDIVEIAKKVKPHRITLVPERREELTTEGGLNVLKEEIHIAEICGIFKKLNVEVALFIEPSMSQLEASRRARVDAIELHTGTFANAYDAGGDWEKEFVRLKKAAESAKDLGFKVYAGHGLNIYNVKPIVEISEIVELNIGHSIIARAAFIGMEEAVKEMKSLIRRHAAFTS